MLVCLHPINVKTAEPIAFKFLCGNPREGLETIQSALKRISNLLLFLKTRDF